MATTINVSAELRDRINRRAQETGLTAAGLIERLLDGYERRRRLEAFGQAFRSADQGYWDETQQWNVTLGDVCDGDSSAPRPNRLGDTRPDARSTYGSGTSPRPPTTADATR